MLRWLFGLFLLVALGGPYVAGAAAHGGCVAANACTTVDAAALAASGAPASTEQPADDVGVEAATDAAALVESARLPRALGLAYALPRPPERPALAPPYLEGLRRPPRA